MADEVLTARRGAVLTITLNRPETYNALNRAVHDALREALAEAAETDVRAVVMTGAGRGFCSGQDLREFQSLPGGVRQALEETYHPNIRAIRALEKPVLAAVNGPAAGAGLSLAAACDVRIASDAANFVPGFIGIGLVPDSGGSWFVHRLLGFARAFEWMVSNRKLSAEEALEWGLVSEVVAADDFTAAGLRPVNMASTRFSRCRKLAATTASTCSTASASIRLAATSWASSSQWPPSSL